MKGMEQSANVRWILSNSKECPLPGLNSCKGTEYNIPICSVEWVYGREVICQDILVMGSENPSSTLTDKFQAGDQV